MECVLKSKRNDVKLPILSYSIEYISVMIHSYDARRMNFPRINCVKSMSGNVDCTLYSVQCTQIDEKSVVYLFT